MFSFIFIVPFPVGEEKQQAMALKSLNPISSLHHHSYTQNHLSLSLSLSKFHLHTSSHSSQMVKEKSLDGKGGVVLTAPLSLDGNESDSDYRTPNIIQRILSLLAAVRPGSDLTRLQLPPQFNIPKSQLQLYGESVYSVRSNMLSKCVEEETPLGRLVAVVAWSISTLRPLPFGVAPYNPLLGETHHVSAASLNVLLEQVSHHPPVTALHATDEKANIEILWCQSPIPKFYGSHIETEVVGKRQLKLVEQKETYTLNSPKLVIRFLPFSGVDWIGDVRIRCEETELEAQLCYRGNSFWPRPSIHRSIKGKIVRSSTSHTIYEINGHWDRSVVVKDVATGKQTTIYDAREALSGLKTPILKDPQAVCSSESSLVWSEVSRAIQEKRWDKARESKSEIEERQREMARERELKGEEWVPKHFTVFHTKESGWDCVPNNNVVAPAPIIVTD
ncbi:oxysterol-binding protein-related protein 4B [Salvia miltiorrhiza]|uniref:oxysterol-binding protein-related protein 4B n=1 Tax=Salvia miltiorrhiza TaxID=226208 RepID=UPI0025ABEBBB|nr:oxysterol-binding protein-related protein 4B [Salvia miltiorrhiza]